VGEVLHAEGISVYVNQRRPRWGRKHCPPRPLHTQPCGFRGCAPVTGVPVRQPAALRMPIREAILVQMVGGGGSETVN
jgi:hypothetical protein